MRHTTGIRPRPHAFPDNSPNKWYAQEDTTKIRGQRDAQRRPFLVMTVYRLDLVRLAWAYRPVRYWLALATGGGNKQTDQSGWGPMEGFFVSSKTLFLRRPFVTVCRITSGQPNLHAHPNLAHNTNEACTTCPSLFDHLLDYVHEQPPNSAKLVSRRLRASPEPLILSSLGPRCLGLPSSLRGRLFCPHIA